MKISEVMTRNPDTIGPEETIQEAARKMLDSDTGSLPVDDGERMIGIITDRDIAVRAVADGRGPETPVREVMSDRPLFAWEDQEVEDVALAMGDVQVRRFPVLDRSERLVGIVSLGDLARSADDDSAEVVLVGVSAPGAAHNQSQE
jgi:CBS domain-containing protein